MKKQIEDLIAQLEKENADTILAQRKCEEEKNELDARYYLGRRTGIRFSCIDKLKKIVSNELTSA